MESLQQRVETWIKDQSTKILKVTWPPQWRMVVKWPWTNGRQQRKRIHEEYERRKKQLHDLCCAVKAESVSDLQDILCCMVLSECVYKRPAAEMLRAVNKFKADFGGQVVSIERVQPSSDHVPHRYLLAEAGDTLFASFIGTKQYKDVMADANILQGAIFHEDAVEDNYETATTESAQVDSQKINVANLSKSLEAKPKQPKPTPKPAVHRGFMARAKGIPALELYRLAQKKKRKLVLCGHSLGGAVAVLATLAILRVIAASSSSKDNEKVQVKCITFSQPPVGNAALRDYVNRKGWHHYFKTYCIPEDLVPRILSPAYFHHYNAQTLPIPVDTKTSDSLMSKREEGVKKQKAEKLKEIEGEQLVLGLGPVQTSFWRLSRLVPLEGVKRQFNKYKGKHVDPVETSSASDSAVTSSFDDEAAAPLSLEIQEGSDGISLKPFPETETGPQGEARDAKSSGKMNTGDTDNNRAWRRVPYLPSYVPFGQLYLLENSSVESLSGAEYSKLTSVRSVIAEVRERFQSHSMKSYRFRFQRIYELCMTDDASFLGVEQLQQFPHLQKWLGLSVAGTVDFGHIVESPVIRAATSVVPLGWSGIPGEKNEEPLKVDITGFGLHRCTLVQARVNGSWCSTTVESFPSSPSHSSDGGVQPDIQNIRVLVGPPLRRQPKHQMADSLLPLFSSIDSKSVDLKVERNVCAFHEGKFIRPEGLSDFVVFCTSDFSTVSKEVHVRTRRVRLVGLEGAGKTSLLKAILGQSRHANIENLHMDIDVQEGIAGGLCYSDSTGVNLQDLNMEASRFRDELWKGICDLSRKTDLIVLVHNLSHIIPRYSQSNASQQQPALSLLPDEAKALGIPWVLAITNKFSVSAHQQKAVIDAVLQAYQASPSTTGVVNSCPYVMPSAASAPQSWGAGDGNSAGRMGPQQLILVPINLVRRPFQKKAVILPVEGVTALCQLVHRVLRSHEEAALRELAQDTLMLELARDRAVAATQDSQAKASSLTNAAVGASLGAGLGIILAVVMGAASALRKP
ncbi:Protein EDS1B [Camellia lanceoleosa]|uniref:Protein EDS1B n=1 Tax=Camellia lanceoleosa TaxID=1840588 RepID=A0ACC0F1L8_9ERIC|nr:Protein EDS1B [Camellia lanceoleosa]